MIDGLPIAQLGPTGLLGILILLILLGRLVPRRTLEDVIAEKNDWKAAYEQEREARAVGAAQVDELLEHARTTDAFIRALPQAAQQRGETR